MKRISCLVLLLYFIPFVILGEGHYIIIHDYLDSSAAHLNAIKNLGIWFEKDAVMPLMDGIRRADFGSPWNIRCLLFMLLSPYWATVANLFLIKLTALLGMYLLLGDKLLRGGSDKVTGITSIAFMLVPFYPDYGISSAGIPLLAWAFITLFEDGAFRRKAAAFSSIIYYGLFSSLVLSGPFVIIVISGVLLAVWIHTKRFILPAFAGLAVLGLTYLGGNWTLVETFLESGGAGAESHRAEFVISKTSLIGEMFGTLAISQYHAGSFPAIVIIPAFLLVSKKSLWLRWSLFILAGLICVGYLSMILFSDIALFREFQFSRFYFLYPGLVFVLLGSTLAELFKNGRKTLFRALLFTVVLFGLVQDPNLRNDGVRALTGTEPSFKDYYDENLFANIKAEVGGEKVACLGLMPAVAEYNGLWTMDAYLTSYSLSYKHSWRKVIAGELDKDSSLKDYFDGWGSRCYLFSSELGARPNWGKQLWQNHEQLKSLDIDTKELKRLGCKYIISAVPIPKPEKLNLSTVGVYEGNWWKLFLYSIDYCL